ncbi:MAG: PorV/PorQ family protein [candidate division Zixibacteria bacterium]|nr:PorV/PorQ family protein [candidate division Zixibacteria bacterium]
MVKKSLLIFGFLVLFSTPVFAAKYAGEFLSLGVGARALGMGGAFVGVADDVTACFWNPSGLCQLNRKQLSLMHAETFGSLLNQDFVAYAFPRVEETSTSAMAFSLQRLGGGGVKITDLEKKGLEISDTNRVVLLGEESHADYALFFSYSHQMKPQFFWGANLKLIYRDVVTTSAFGIGADLGLLVKPCSFLSLGANLMDLTSSLLFYDNGTTETINPTTKLGLAINHELKDFYLIFATDADVRYEGRKSAAQFWLGKISADMHFGMEVSYKRKLAGRLGFDQGDFTAGVGFWINPTFGGDVAFLSHEELDNTYRISLLLKL